MRLSILILIGLLPVSQVAAGAAESGRLIAEGERLRYDVTWMGIRAGQATLETWGIVRLNGQPAYRLVTTAESAPALSKIYRVEDRSESYLGVNPTRSLRFEKHLREGRYRHSSQTEFDHQAGVATFRYLDFSQVPRGISRLDEAERYGRYVQQEFALVPGSLDELSVLYYVRTLPLPVGTTTVAKVFASKKNWELEVRVLGRETLETALGRRETVVVEPLLKFEGIFQRKGRVVVWLTDDPEKIPVRMKSEVIIGSFVATLTRREVGRTEPSPGVARSPGKGE
jgi:hypothetical protein